jgi:alpha-tubulin suppressor-like RCC1 family protein
MCLMWFLVVGALLTPMKVTLKGGAARVWAGYHATFALHSTGDKLYAWGLNNYGQLGQSPIANILT